MAINYNNFKFNSSQKMDSVVYTYATAVQNTSPYNTYVSLSIPHQLPFKPLCFGNFSIDNGQTWLDIDFETQLDAGHIYSNASTVEVSFSYTPVIASTVLVRIYAFPPATYANSNFNKPTPISHFYINTNNKYDNLVMSGSTKITSSQDQVICSHNLGYIPRVMLWGERSWDGSIYRISYSSLGLEDIWVTNTQIIGHYPWDTPTIHYRIYGGANA